MSPVIAFSVFAFCIFPHVKAQAGISPGNSGTFSGNTGLGAINSATDLRPPANARPVGAGGAPNNPDMQAVQDPSRFQMAPFIGPEGASATLQRNRSPGEAMSGDPIPARPISDRQRLTNYINEQRIAATLPKLCSVHPTMRFMKVMPMPMITGNPPENRGQLGMTPAAGGPLLNRMQLVQPQFPNSNGAQNPMNIQQAMMQNMGAVMPSSIPQSMNDMSSNTGNTVPMSSLFVGGPQIHMKLPSSGTVVGVQLTGMDAIQTQPKYANFLSEKTAKMS